ncbi:MAG TPA: hypothetical protein EYH05_14040 [Anaerolineae bacterium]|nr:hypothetical protein [Anaerolineae bacterium]
MLSKIRSFFISFFLLSITLLLMGLALQERQPINPSAAQAQTNTDLPVGPAYGVNFISWAKGQTPVSDQRYANGRSTGAVWNRWPMYWTNIEQSEGSFSWDYQDVAVENDIAQGFQIDAILLGTPSFYTTSPAEENFTPVPGSILAVNEIQAATPQGLYDPVFADGTDTPGAGKVINQDNRWARFVYTADNRYKPGGILAQQNNWTNGEGVTHWEIWNEPDLFQFWDGTVEDYARLLKVGYLAAKQADPNAQIIFGGVANVGDPNTGVSDFYNRVMGLYDADPDAPTYGYYHDVFATHNYLYAWRSWLYVWRAGNTQRARDLDKPIWLNESGVPVWDDYPGPVCEPDSPYRATMSEQADFIIQSAFFATFAGADNLFFFQLYDDCGNQPGGTNHAYYPPSACTGDPTVDPGGDAFGLFRNPNDPAQAGCYWDSPQPESPREGLAAFQVLSTYLTGVEPLWRQRPNNNAQEWIAFYQPGTQSRVLGVWSRGGSVETAVITATSSAGTATLIGPENNPQLITAVNGVYTVTLPAATNHNALWDPTLYPIEGRPSILIEQDDLPPTVSLTAPPIAFTQIDLSWSGEDLGSGMDSYDLFVAMDDGIPTPVLVATTAVTTTYPAELEHSYRFTLRGRDKAGNESGFTAVTVITRDLPEKVYLPVVSSNR